MSEQQPPRPNQPPPLVPLDYRGPEPMRPAGGMSFGGQVMLGFVAFLAFGFVGLCLTFATGSGLLGLGGAMGLLVIHTVYLRVRCGWRGFFVGVLIGVGLVALAFGLCIAILKGMGAP